MSVEGDAYAKAKETGWSRVGHLPTEANRRLVRNLAGLAVAQKDIARMINVSFDTLHRHYAEDVEAGRSEANLKVAQAMFKAATREGNPNVVAGMFWLKNRAGWKDIGAAAQSGPVTLHLLAAQEVGKQIIGEMQRAQPPTIQGEAVTDGAVNVHDAPLPTE